MKRLALTGGIACGKSSALAELGSHAGVAVISCDDVVHDLYQDGEILNALRERFGDEIFESESIVSRSRLGKLVFDSEESRNWLEELFHPRVLQRVNDWRDALIGVELSVVEVPLLYEVDFPLEYDMDVCIASSPDAQLRRLMLRNALNQEAAEKRIGSQLPISEKVRRARVVIWNEGTLSSLQRQVRTLVASERAKI